jgi:hypothetical protein
MTLLSIVGFLIISSWVFESTRTVASVATTRGLPADSAVFLGWSLLWVLLFVSSILDAVGANGNLDNDGHYLTIRPASDIASGMLLANVFRIGSLAVLPVLASAVGFVIETGSPYPVISIVAAAVICSTTSIAAGYPIGLILKTVIRRSATLSSAKPVMAVALGAGYVVVLFTGGYTAMIEWIRPVLFSAPLAWIGQLSLSTVPGVSPEMRSISGLVIVSNLLVVAGTVLSSVTARYAWTTDRTRLDESDKEDPERGTPPRSHVDTLVRRVCSRQETTTIASTTLLRAWRSPLQLLFVAFPVIALMPLVEMLLTTGDLPWYAPWLVVWYGALAGGAGPPLNPLGNQGATLPTVLTASADGRNVVNGHIVAAILPIAPLTAVLSVATGLFAGQSVPELLVIGAAGATAVVVGSALAVGVGTLFPRFETFDLTASRQAVAPSKVAYGIFSTIISVAVVGIAVIVNDTAAEITAFLLSDTLPFDISIAVGSVVRGGWIVLVLAVIAVPAAYWIAVRRIQNYHLS